MASCQIPCTGKPCMDNAPKSITYITWTGRSAAELVVESHEAQWMWVQAGSSRLASGCSCRRGSSDLRVWSLFLLYLLSQTGPELLCQKNVRWCNCNSNNHIVSSPLTTGSLCILSKCFWNWAPSLLYYKCVEFHACEGSYQKISNDLWVRLSLNGWGWKGALERISSKPPAQAQDHIQVGFGHLQTRTVHNLCAQPVLGLHHLHSKKGFSS